MKWPGLHDTRLATERRQCGGAPRKSHQDRAPMRRGPIEEKDSREGPDAAGAKRKGRPSMRRGRFRRSGPPCGEGGSRELSMAVLFRETWRGPGGGPRHALVRVFL